MNRVLKWMFVSKEKESDESEAVRVRKQVERIKGEAMDSGVPKLISELYHDNIHHYPSWIKHTPRDYVPVIITEARELKIESKPRETVLLIMNGREYKFTYEEHNSYAPGDDSFYGDLELFFNGEKVLQVNEIVSYDEWGSNHSPISVDAFIDGDWVKDFQELKSEIKKAEAQREKREFKNPDEIEKLKKDFGIQ